MTRHQLLKQTNAFATFDGLFFGVYFCVGFLCTIKGISSNALSMLGFLITITAPVLGCYFANRFEKQVRVDGLVKYNRAYLYCSLMYIYASILLALFTFIYFTWLDNGSFASSYISAYYSADVQQVVKEYNWDAVLKQEMQENGFKNIEELIESIKPIDIASGILNCNITIGLLLALPTAFFARSRHAGTIKIN